MRVNLDHARFAGVSCSFTVRAGPRRHPECRCCGSSLAGRLETMRRVAGAHGVPPIEVDVYRCPCGRRRRGIRQPEGAKR